MASWVLSLSQTCILLLHLWPPAELAMRALGTWGVCVNNTVGVRIVSYEMTAQCCNASTLPSVGRTLEKGVRLYSRQC